MKPQALIPTAQIEHAILLVRGQRVMLDCDLAALYGVTTSNLNRAVKRNQDRFPSDFMFQLVKDEAQNLRFQNGISSSAYGGRRYLPYAFTEPGVAMLSSVCGANRPSGSTLPSCAPSCACAKHLGFTRNWPLRLTPWNKNSEVMTPPSGRYLKPSASSRHHRRLPPGPRSASTSEKNLPPTAHVKADKFLVSRSFGTYVTINPGTQPIYGWDRRPSNPKSQRNGRKSLPQVAPIEGETVEFYVSFTKLNGTLGMQ